MFKPLFLVVIILLIVIYTQYYMKYNTTYRIVQAPLNKVDENLLYEKYPIVVADRVVKPESLLSTLFKYKYLTNTFEMRPGSQNPYFVLNKYTIIYNNVEDIDINIIAPQYRNEFKGFKSNIDINSTQVQYVTIKLKKQQIIILPAFWIYQANLPHTVISLNDPLSLIISCMY